jgi:drug/metabolite transporter (DMT)-like permease
MTDQSRAIAFALVAVLFWSTVATAFKLSLAHLTPVELLLYATVFSTTLLAIILIQQKKFGWVFQCSRNEYLLSIQLGFLNPFLYYLILFKAYDLLPAQQAQPINYTWAITLALLSVPLLKHRIGWQQWLALIVSYIGVVVISTEGKPLDLNFTSPFGVFLALVSTVVWALYWIFNTRDQRDPVVALFVNFVFSLPFILLYYLVFEEVRLVPIEGILGAVYVGLFEMGICFVLWLMAMKLTDNTARISNLIFLSPFLSLVFIHFILGEEVLAATFVGLVLIVIGLLIQRIKSNPDKTMERSAHE